MLEVTPIIRPDKASPDYVSQLEKQNKFLLELVARLLDQINE